ncbi:MAG: hypothetical protein POH28_15810, partial [Acidocella sp.]|nr:hypothetical protein [Acidocella sp.]
MFVSNLATGVRPGPIPGFPNWLDPNIGYTTQALGYRAAQDWLRGVVPWWDPYQGVGAPLAAELQNGAFFLPFSLLLHFSTGWLLLRLLMQCLAGCFTYALLNLLRLSRQAALLGGVLYGCSSSFIILAHAPSYTFPFLPLLLLGIERGLASDRRFDPGWSWVIIAVAYSFYAGFPETGSLADMLGGLWFIVRLFAHPRPDRAALIGRFTLAVGTGVVLTLPGLLPFYNYLRDGYIGIHAHGAATASLPLMGLTTQILPQAFGPFGVEIVLPQGSRDPAMRSLILSWLSAGGWVGLLPLTLAIVGLSSRKGVLQPLRWLLLIWIVLWEARIFGFRPVVAMLDVLPPLRVMLVERYAEPSVDFAIILLGAMGFDYWQRHGLTRRVMIAVGGSIGAILMIAFVIGAPAYREAIHLVPHLTGITLAYLAMTVLACTALL